MKNKSRFQLSNSTLTKLFILILVCSNSLVYSQTGSIKGKITDVIGDEPLIGAAAMIKGTSLGSASNFDGDYIISDLKPGKYTIISSYISYKPLTKENIVVVAGQETVVNIQLESANISLKEVELVGKLNRESENILLMEQKQSLLATQAVGAKEMSRKGISNAEAAVAQVSGVSKQDGVKNVFVRGLGDRFNFTTLNGFPIPSEDPEYKNISLDFFGSDIIQNIGVNKAFSGSNYSDVAGAVIDITSKELVGNKELNLDVAAGFNTQALGSDFQNTDGVNYLGISNNIQPGKSSYRTVYNYGNSLDPHVGSLPVNNSYGFSGGKSYKLGANSNPLSFYLVGSYSTNYKYSSYLRGAELIYETLSNGDTEKDIQGEKSTQNINQLILGNVNFQLNRKHTFNYNFMMIHDNTQYVGIYTGWASEFVSSLQDQAYENLGAVIRQQTNGNTLLINQLTADLKLSDKLKLETGLAYNIVKGTEPDRRVNKLFKKSDTQYQLLAGDGSHVRNYNELIENDINGKIAFTYDLAKKFKKDVSALNFGYNGRLMYDDFNSAEYSMVVTGLNETATLDNLKLDDWFNQENYDNSKFAGSARFSDYQVLKMINAGYFNLDYQFNSKFTTSIGLRAEQVLLNIEYNVQGGYNGDGTQSLNRFYPLPSLNLKYDLNDKNSLRLGLSKTYTLPQSKEISPYQYLGLSFSSQGNPNLETSDNYNADLKWDYYMSSSELLSITGFYKQIKNPIARAYEGSGAGYFTYTNISDQATVAGIELEVRKNIINKVNTEQEKSSKLTAGLNASYIYTNMYVEINASAPKESAMEGAAPYIFNIDLSYDYTHKNVSFINALVLNYVSDKIYSIGAGGFNDVIEKAVPALDFVSTYKMNKHLSFKLKAKNLLDPTYKFTREAADNAGNKVLNSYKKGMDISFGISYNIF